MELYISLKMMQTILIHNTGYIYNCLGSVSDTEPLSVSKTTQNVGINYVSGM